MIKLKNLAIFAAAIGLTGCSAQDVLVQEEEQNPSEPATRTFTLRASMPTSETRVSADADWNLTWQAGDAIALVDENGDSITLHLKTGFEGKSEAEFTRIVPDDYTPIAEGFTPKYAIYPASKFKSYEVASGGSEQELKVIPNNLYEWINGDEIRCLMIGEVSSLADVTNSEDTNADVSMKHLCGGISFEFENLPGSVKAISFKCSEDDCITGDYIANRINDVYTIEKKENTGAFNNTVYLQLPSQNRPSRIYFPLPVGWYSGFTLYANDGNSDTAELCKYDEPFEITRAGVACYPKITLPDYTVKAIQQSN